MNMFIYIVFISYMVKGFRTGPRIIFYVFFIILLFHDVCLVFILDPAFAEFPNLKILKDI